MTTFSVWNFAGGLEGRIFRFGVVCNFDLQHVARLKAARALLGWSQGDLAMNSGVSVPTVKRLEAADGDIGGRAETGEALVAALQEAGVEFILENGGGAGVRLAKRIRRPR
jgi:transcriptional regulator with XRE-family HTH domain